MKTTEDKLMDLFDDLQENAYNVEFHNYHYKEANQIFRKHWELIAPPDSTKQRILRAIKWVVKIIMRIIGWPFMIVMMLLKLSQLWLMYGGNTMVGDYRKEHDHKHRL